MGAPKTLPQGEKSVVAGLDISFSTVNVGLATLDGKRRAVVAYDLPQRLKDGERLATIQQLFKSKVVELLTHLPIIAAAVEQPSGRFNKPQLYYLAGVLQVAFFEALSEHWGGPMPVFTVASPDWKKQVLGTSGKASYKPKPGDDREYLALTIAHELGYPGSDDNDADAFCLTEHVRRIVSVS